MFSTSINWSWISAVVLLCCIGTAWGQSAQQLGRYEVLLDRNAGGYDVSTEPNGMVLRRHMMGPKSDQIELIRLDTALSEKWRGVISIERNHVILGHSQDGNKLYLLLRYRDYSRNDLILLSIENETGDYIQYKIKGYIPFAPTEFRVMSKAVVIGGYFNRTPLLLFFSLETYKSRVLPGFTSESGELNQIRVNDDETFDAVFSTMNMARQKTISIRRYDDQGNLLANFSLTPEDNKHLIFGRLVATEDNMQIIAGVYGSRSADFSRGIFISTIDPSGFSQIRYYSFGDLENFFKYMKAKREQRVKQRIERRKVKGKKTRFNYRFLLHEVIPYQDKFLLLGEAFYPKYSYAQPGSAFFQPNVRGPFRDGRVFDGYQYTHAVIMAFNKNGDLLWDNSFEIKDVRTFQLEQFVRAQLFDDKIALSYVYDNTLRSKIIHNNEVLEASSHVLMNNPSEVGHPAVNSTASLKNWYDNVMFTNGIEDIETPGGRHKRRVFYINKIQLYDSK